MKLATFAFAVLLSAQAHAENILECGQIQLHLDYVRADGVALVGYTTPGGFLRGPKTSVGFGTINKLEGREAYSGSRELGDAAVISVVTRIELGEIVGDVTISSDEGVNTEKSIPCKYLR